MTKAILSISEINVEDDDSKTHLKKLPLKKENMSQFLKSFDEKNNKIIYSKLNKNI